jgi:Fic family protein
MLLLLKAGYIYVPYSSLESIVEHNKEGYYLSLRQTQGTLRSSNPNWQPWLVYFMRMLQQQQRKLSKKIELEKIRGEKLPELSSQIIDYVRQYDRVTMGDILMVTGASRNTLKDHFRRLQDQGYLVRQGNGKATWYILP